MKYIRLILLGLTLSSIALGCGGDSSDDESDSLAGTGSPGGSGSMNTYGTSGTTTTGGSGGSDGFSILEREPFFCGATQCTELEPTVGGLENVLSFGMQYCCTDTKNLCSVQMIGATSCPDTVVCGGQECRTLATDLTGIIGSFVSAGTVCCSPSDRCSVMPIGATECPEPDDGFDPDCPSVSDLFGVLGTTIEESGFGGQGCCSSDNTCGVIFMGSCVPSLAGTFPGLDNAQIYDCDGNLIEQDVPDGGDMDAASHGDAAVDDDDSGA